MVGKRDIHTAQLFSLNFQTKNIQNYIIILITLTAHIQIFSLTSHAQTWWVKPHKGFPFLLSSLTFFFLKLTTHYTFTHKYRATHSHTNNLCNYSTPQSNSSIPTYPSFLSLQLTTHVPLFIQLSLIPTQTNPGYCVHSA